MNDKMLVDLMQNGSRDAFDRIYALYSKKLYLYCLQYVKSREDAEDIVQNVFMNLWVSRHTIQHGELLNVFIFRSAKNQIINRYKSNLNSAIYEHYTEYCNDMRLSVANTSAPLEYDDFCRRLEKAMAKLPDTQRKAVELVKLQNIPLKEAAEALSLKEQTVKNAVTAGLKVLRAFFEKDRGSMGAVMLIILNL
ncbi:MAG: RNA polymerase sigma factor [Muribaculaceae bacterium]